MTERAQRGVAVARVEERGGDPAEIPRPHEVIDVVAVVVGLTPGRRWGGDERASVRLVLEAVKDR